MRSPAKKVKTFDLDGKENGYLIELNKRGRRTAAYMSVAYPGCFKGYHLHNVREANYICVKGKVRIILYGKNGREEYILDANDPEYFHIPMNVPTGLQNEWDEEAWLINFPDPEYDPKLKGEQVDFDEEGALEWVKQQNASSKQST